MTAHGKTDSEAALLTWTLRNLKSNKGHQRRDAVTEITYSRDLDYIPALMALLVSAPLYPTQKEISVGLRSFGDAAVLPLLEALASSDSRARLHAALVLRELPDARAVRPLITALETDPDTDVRGAAAQALGGIHDPRAFAPLVHALDRDPAIAVVAAQALARYGDHHAIHALLNEIPDIQDIDGKLRLIQTHTQTSLR